MSHIVTIETQVRDPLAIGAACQRLGLPQPKEGTAELFSGSESGIIVALPGWTYPLVCQTETGVLKYDNFEGRWGDQSQLDRFLQSYAVEKTRLEARKQGYSVLEQPLAGGAIKLTIQATGGAA